MLTAIVALGILSGLFGLLLGSWAGDVLTQALLGGWRWVREEILHQEDEVDFELLLQ